MLEWGREVIILLYNQESISDLVWKNLHQNVSTNCIKMVAYCINLSKTLAVSSKLTTCI